MKDSYLFKMIKKNLDYNLATESQILERLNKVVYIKDISDFLEVMSATVERLHTSIEDSYIRVQFVSYLTDSYTLRFILELGKKDVFFLRLAKGLTPAYWQSWESVDKFPQALDDFKKWMET